MGGNDTVVGLSEGAGLVAGRVTETNVGGAEAGESNVGVDVFGGKLAGVDKLSGFCGEHAVINHVINNRKL